MHIKDSLLLQRPVVCVVGPPCGGSAAVTLLDALEIPFDSAEHLDPAAGAPDAPEQHRELAEINDQILHRCGGSWHHPPAFEPRWETSTALTDLSERAAEILRVNLANSEAWAWNDPRTSLTLPFWQQLLPSLRFLICLRNPLDAARSLEREKRLSMEHASWLWLSYVSAAIAHTTGRPRLALWHEDVVDDAARQLVRCAAFLDRPWSEPTMADARRRATVLASGFSTVEEVLAEQRVDPAARAFFVLLHRERTEASSEQRHDVDVLAESLVRSHKSIGNVQEALARAAREADEVRARLAQLTASPAWQWALRLNRLRRQLAPDGSVAHSVLRQLRRARTLRAGKAGFSTPGTAPQCTLLMPVEGADPARVRETVSSVLEQTDPRWELLLLDEERAIQLVDIPADRRIRRCTVVRPGRAAALNAGLTAAGGAFVATLEPGDQLAPDALQAILDDLERLRVDVVYTDEETISGLGPPDHAFAKPDWSPELLLSFPYTGRLCLLRRELVVSLGGWDQRTVEAEDYALVLAATRAGASIRRLDRTLYRRNRTHIGHVCSTPGAIAARRVALVEHLSASGQAFEVVRDKGPAGIRVRPPLAGHPLVSIIIATRDRVGLLDQCIQSIVSRTRYDAYEIILVDNDSVEEETARYFERTPHTVVRAPGSFNFSAVNNAGARAARGEYLLFLNNDTEVVAGDWLESMLEWAGQPGIGCVGAKLLFPDGRIQHAGVTLHDGSAFHPGYGQRSGDATWLEYELVRNFTAVTAACLLVRSSIFAEVGGFDEGFPVAYNDVELCVRVMRKGYRNLFTPYAVLYHHESSSRPPGVRLAENERLQKAVGPLLWSDPYCPANQRSAPSRPRLLQRAPSRSRGRLRRASSRIIEVLTAAAWHRTPLKTAEVALSSVESGQAEAAPEAVRWLDSVEIDGRRRIGLFMHPVSQRTFRLTVPPDGRFVAWIALLPDAWRRNTGGVRFEVSLQTGRELGRSHQWVIDPGLRSRHRGWTRVMVPLSYAEGRELELTLRTSLPDGASPGHAWAVWGDPLILERKALRGIVRRQLGVVRSIGLRATLRRYARLWRGYPVDPAVYDSWYRERRDASGDIDLLRRSIEAFDYRPRISLITPVYNTDPQWLRRLVESVAVQAYREWELCLGDDGSTRHETLTMLEALEREDSRIKVVRLTRNSGISAASNAALALATGEFIGLVDHDDELAPDALFEIARLLNDHRDADIVYTDEDKLEFDGTHTEPYFKPDWSPEYLRSTMYVGHLTVYRRSLVNTIGGFRSEFDGAQDYDLALRATAETDRVHHIPKILYHWRKIPGSAAGDATAKPWGLTAARRALVDHVSRLPIPATVEDEPGNGFWRVRYSIPGNPLVSVVIPTDGRIVQTPHGNRDLALHCVRSILERTTYTNYEILIADNGTLSPRVMELLDGVPHRRLVYEMTRPFNFAAKVNFAARHARGEHLLLLNDDTEVITGEWMSAMLEFSQQPAIGAVGGKLFYPDGRIQHVGVVLGIGGGACHVLAGQAGDSPGYFGSALVIRNYSAVTGACCMTRRAVFEEAGGFDERFALDFNDVDYCLRLGARGHRIVGTPFAQLYHFEGASFGSREHVVNPEEISALSERWGSVIAADPFYNPNLTRSGLDYSLRL